MNVVSGTLNDFAILQLTIFEEDHPMIAIHGVIGKCLKRVFCLTYFEPKTFDTF